EITRLAFGPPESGGYLATAGKDLKINLWHWDALASRIVLSLRGPEKDIYGLVFRPDGRELASVGLDGKVRVWDAAPDQEVRTIPNRSPLLGAAFSPEGKYLAAGSGEGNVKVWRAAGGDQPLLDLKGHGDSVYQVVFSPTGRRLAS